MKFLTKASVVSLATIASTMLGAAPAFASESNLNVAQTNLETPLAWVDEAPSEKFEVTDGTNHIKPDNLKVKNEFMRNATGVDNDLLVNYTKDSQAVSQKVGSVKDFTLGIGKVTATVQDGRATAAGWSVTHQATAKATTSKGAVKNMKAVETINSIAMITDNVGGIKANVYGNGVRPTTIDKKQHGSFATLAQLTLDSSLGVNKVISVDSAASAGAGHELNGQGNTKVVNQFIGNAQQPGQVHFTFVNPNDKVENGDTVSYTATWTLNATPVGV